MTESYRGRVLCVDDSPMLLQMLSRYLSLQGYLVSTACSGRGALEAIAANPINAVILDYDLIDLKGAEVATEIRRIKPDVTTILYSGAAAAMSEDLSAMVDAIIDKQEGVSVLLTVLNGYLPEPASHTGVRKYPRYHLEQPLSLTFMRGVDPGLLSAQSISLSEGGIAAEVEVDLRQDEEVMINLECLNDRSIPPNPRARVRYRNRNVYGFEFLGLSPLQRAHLRRCCNRLASAFS